MFKIITSKHSFSEGDYFLSDLGKELLYKLADETIHGNLDLCPFLPVGFKCDSCPLSMAIMETKGLKSDDEWDYSEDCNKQITPTEFYNWMYENWWRFLIKEDGNSNNTNDPETPKETI